MWQNGSGELQLNAVFSEGRVTPSLIKRDVTAISISYSTKSGNNYTFANLQPGIYIVQYDLENCSNYVYDTFNLKAYDFPSLAQSSLFQCNNNSFNVNALATGGIGPYTYEIIGSTPASPSIVQGPQAGQAFTINNGTSYTVVRLRAIDVCGNATINDASVLPLGNTVISASSDCFYNNVNLSVDTIPGAVYTWYKQTSSGNVLMGAGPIFNIPYMLPGDTGVYINVAAVNSGCLTKTASIRVTGACGFGLLGAGGISFEGSLVKGNTQLKWMTDNSFAGSGFIIQRSDDGIHFKQIGMMTVAAGNQSAAGHYFFTDSNTPMGKSLYRIAVVKQDFSQVYSRAIEINKTAQGDISVLANPVQEAFVLTFSHVKPGNYIVRLVTAEGRIVLSTNYNILAIDRKTIQRPAGLLPGVYYLRIRHSDGSSNGLIKLLFK
jgi:hypothetical protein